jgi:hypothetical protein
MKSAFTATEIEDEPFNWVFLTLCDDRKLRIEEEP